MATIAVPGLLVDDVTSQLQISLVIVGSVAKWPSTVSLNCSRAGTTTSTETRSAVLPTTERIMSKSRVLDSRNCASAASLAFLSSWGCSSRVIPHSLHFTRLVVLLEPERSTWACVHVAKVCALRVLVTEPQVLQVRISMYELLPDLLKVLQPPLHLGRKPALDDAVPSLLAIGSSTGVGGIIVLRGCFLSCLPLWDPNPLPHSTHAPSSRNHPNTWTGTSVFDPKGHTQGRHATHSHCDVRK